MLALFYGTDTGSVRNAAHAHLPKEVSQPTTIDAEVYQRGMLADAVEAVSLFGGVNAYVLDTPSDDEDFQEEVMGLLSALAASAHLFVVIEGKLLAAERKKYEKYAEVVSEFTAPAVERFNTFALSDALADRNKKKLWLLCSDATRAGVSSEELIGMMWWQLKTLRLATVTSSAAEAGMKDFPYNKAKRALGNFKEGELISLSHSLLALHHDARRGKHDLDLALERWVLSL
ncbi:MAG: hypothetical protein WDZ93_03915 [Candidatus Paceibacterota bacterium]